MGYFMNTKHSFTNCYSNNSNVWSMGNTLEAYGTVTIATEPDFLKNTPLTTASCA